MRQVVDSLKSGKRLGAYWGIRTDIADYLLSDALDAPHARTFALAETPTRLRRLSSELQERLINWGYAACDAAVRRYVDASIAAPSALPYPGAGI